MINALDCGILKTQRMFAEVTYALSVRRAIKDNSASRGTFLAQSCFNGWPKLHEKA